MIIVAVDDSPTVLMTISAILEEMGVEVSDIYTFTSGNEALEFIREKRADIVFSDVQMPEMDGYRFAQTLIDEQPEYVSKLFIVSADESKECVVNMKAAGAKRFIRKPINVQHFNHFVKPEIDKLNKKNLKEAQMASALDEKIDLEALAAKIGISPKHMPKLLNGFLNESESNLELLEKAVQEKKFPEIARLAHSIKGSAGNMKFDDLYERVKLMEAAAHANEDDFPFLDEFNNIKKYFNQIKQASS